MARRLANLVGYVILGKKPLDVRQSKNSEYFSLLLTCKRSILKSPQITTSLFNLLTFETKGLYSVIKLSIVSLFLLNFGGLYVFTIVIGLESESPVMSIARACHRDDLFSENLTDEVNLFETYIMSPPCFEHDASCPIGVYPGMSNRYMLDWLVNHDSCKQMTLMS